MNRILNLAFVAGLSFLIWTVGTINKGTEELRELSAESQSAVETTREPLPRWMLEDWISCDFWEQPQEVVAVVDGYRVSGILIDYYGLPVFVSAGDALGNICYRLDMEFVHMGEVTIVSYYQQ